MAVATQNRKQTHEDDNQDFKEKHDALSATINSARTNISQAESEKRELLRQGYTENDAEVQEIAGKIKAEQKRETGRHRRDAPAHPATRPETRADSRDATHDQPERHAVLQGWRLSDLEERTASKDHKDQS